METREIQIPQGALIGPERRPIYGYRTASAKCEGGLCVHRANKGERWRWKVTHEASGMALERLGHMTQAAAIANMRKALALDFNWSRPADAVIDDLKMRRDIMDEINRIATHN